MAVQYSHLINFYRGATHKVPYVFRAAGLLVDLTGKAVFFRLRNQNGKEVLYLASGTPANVKGSVLTITNALGGAFTVLITDEETAAFTFQNGTWEIGVIDSAGDIRFIGKGRATEGFAK